MTGFVVDSFAFMAYYRNEPGADEVLGLIQQALDKKSLLYVTSYNLGELYYMTWRKHGPSFADMVWEELMKLPIQIIVPDLALTLDAATIKANGRLSYADAHAAALALHLKVTLLTGDREFDSLKNIRGFRVKYLTT